MKTFVIAVLISLSLNGTAQSDHSMDAFNKERNKISKTGMTVLTAWGVGNLGYGLIAMGQTSGSTKYFNQMNAIWGGVNAAIGALGYLGSSRNKPLSLYETAKAQFGTERTFLFNAGLDLTYIASGLYIRERAPRISSKNPARWKGYGESFIFQGAGLLLFDVVMFSVHHAHGKKLPSLFNATSIQIGPGQVGLIVKL